jgi:hypothetical protein
MICSNAAKNIVMYPRNGPIFVAVFDATTATNADARSARPRDEARKLRSRNEKFALRTTKLPIPIRAGSRPINEKETCDVDPTFGCLA